MAAINVPLFPEKNNSEAICDWWQAIMRQGGIYPSYAFFLVLKSDRNVTNYLSEYGAELDFISGEDCLILAFNKNKFRRSGVDRKMRSVETFRSAGRRINMAYWKMLIKDLISEGYSVQIANHFQIPFDKFPCLVVFKDINSPEHIIISLSDMDVDEIAKRMKAIFSTIHKAVKENKPVLSELEKLRTKETFKKGGQVLVSSITSLVGKTVNTAMEAWIKASLSLPAH